MAVQFHVATFFYDVPIRNRWARTVERCVERCVDRSMDRVQTVEEFLEKVSNEETNAEVVSVVTEIPGVTPMMVIIMRSDRAEPE